MNTIVKKLTLIGTLALLLVYPSAALATPITGSVAFAGAVAGIGSSNWMVATGLSFPSLVTVAAATGSFAPMSGMANAVDFYDVYYQPPNTPITPQWSYFDGASTTFSFDLNKLRIDFRDSTNIALQGSGIIHITGFDDTPGSWTLTANSLGQTLSFSAGTAAPVPEPGTLILLGAGLVGAAIFARRKLHP